MEPYSQSSLSHAHLMTKNMLIKGDISKMSKIVHKNVFQLFICVPGAQLHLVHAYTLSVICFYLCVHVLYINAELQ